MTDIVSSQRPFRFPRDLLVGNVRYVFAAMAEHKGGTEKTDHYVEYLRARNIFAVMTTM